MYILNFLKKYYLIILIMSALWAWVWYMSWSFFWKNYVKLQLFTTISVNDENSSISDKEEASTYFWETLIWWFQNPSFTSKILKNHNWDKYISAYKQERQNLIIEIKWESEEDVQRIARDAFLFLKKKIAEINRNSNSKYLLIDQWYNFHNSFDIKITYSILFFILFWFLTIVFFNIMSSLRWIGLHENEIKKILWPWLIDYISTKFSAHDYSIISVWIHKLEGPVILWWVWVNINELSVLLSKKHSFFWEDMVLIDWDLETRSLQYEMWLSSRLKNLKWVTNLEPWTSKLKLLKASTKASKALKTTKAKTGTSKVIDNKLHIQDTFNDRLKFIPAWTWTTISCDILEQISEKIKIVIHTHLPQNADILRLGKWALVLVVKIWSTKLEDLMKIKEVWWLDIKYIIIK